MAGGLACGDWRRRTGSDSALEALRDDGLYKYTFTLLTYFTVLITDRPTKVELGIYVISVYSISEQTMVRLSTCYHHQHHHCHHDRYYFNLYCSDLKTGCFISYVAFVDRFLSASLFFSKRGAY